MASLYRGGMIHGGVYLAGPGSAKCLHWNPIAPGDVFAPLIRDGAGRLAFANPCSTPCAPAWALHRALMKARDGNVHAAAPETAVAYAQPPGRHDLRSQRDSHGRRLKGLSGTVAPLHWRRRHLDRGLHEALNQAAVEKLPLVVVVANNQYAYSTRPRASSPANPRRPRPGYGITAHGRRRRPG